MRLFANKWFLLSLLLVIGIVVIGAAVAAFSLSRPRQATVTATPAETPSPLPMPSASPATPLPNEADESYEKALSDDASQAFVTKLPHDTAYWSLTYGGKIGDKYRFIAT